MAVVAAPSHYYYYYYQMLAQATALTPADVTYIYIYVCAYAASSFV